MKKLVALLLLFAIALSLVACGEDSSNTQNSEAQFQKAQFQKKYTEIYSKIKTMNENCVSYTDDIYFIWDVVGAEDAAGTIEYMLGMTNSFDTYWDDTTIGGMYNWYEYLLAGEMGWTRNTSFGIADSESAEEFHTWCMELQKEHNTIKSLNDEISEQIKELRTTYRDDFSYEVDLLNELYVEASAFADFSLEPSGNLLSYGNNKSTYADKVSKLLKSADLY